MKNIELKTKGAWVLGILILTLLIQISVSAQDPGNQEQDTRQFTKDDSPSQRNERQLIGTWDVQVTLRNCQTGSAMRTFPSVGTFMEGGTLLDSTSGIPQTMKTPGQGVWSFVEANIYRFKIKSFNFDAGGNFTGWTVIKHEARLNRGADQYISSGTAEVYGTNGVLMFSGCSSTTATRFE